MTKAKEDTSFTDLGIGPEVLKAVSAMGFEEPTPIQRKAIPLLLEGHDIIGQAQTGTGKTAAFGIPIVDAIDTKSMAVQALIITPTRELAVQVAEEVNSLGRFKGLHALPVYGGTSIERQIKALGRGVRVVVGTPGRVLDHISRRTLDLRKVKTLVLDEAAEMLDMGFIDDIKKIIDATPKDRQTLLFSATMAPEIQNIAKRHMKSPKKVGVQAETLTASKVDQIFYEVKPSYKLEALCRLIDADAEGMFLVFCHTKKEAAEVADQLRLRGYDSDAIHGDLTQFQREAVLARFRDSKVDVLCATDVAARGLDISGISHVINYAIPQNPESYVHRIGRTGRAGRAGVAVTFVSPREEKQLRLIRAVSKADIKRGKLPSLKEVMAARLATLKEKCHEFIDDKRFKTFMDMAEKLTEEVDPMDAVASLIKFQLEGFADLSKAQGPAELDYTGAAPGMTRLFMTIGREQGVSAPDIVSTISRKAGIPKGAIKDVKIFDAFTFVEVPRDSAEKVIEFMHRSIISGRKVAVSPARPRESKR